MFIRKTVYIALLLLALPLQGQILPKQSFDVDPQWEGRNNRLARELPPQTVTQNFGYSADTNHAGGKPGEIGGVVQSAAEPAYYAMRIPKKTLQDHLTASGRLFVGPSDCNILFGFFNDRTAKEWRTPNAIVVRVIGGDGVFQAHQEFATGRWRAAATIVDDYDSGKENTKPLGFPAGVAYRWSLEYNPYGHGGSGTITIIIGEKKSVINIPPDLRRDGATFNRFGLLNVMKSADRVGELWLDDLVVDGKPQDLSVDPHWDGMRNRTTYKTTVVRPRFDFGFSPTHYAGGAASGEIGGVTYRGDCRYANMMASYGDRLGKLTLDSPLHASGKVVFRRGVTDSATIFGFYNSVSSMATENSQKFGIPRDFLGICIEGPSREGFFFYPTYRNQSYSAASGYPSNPSYILPDGKPHNWTLDYDPKASGGNGSLTITLDSRTTTVHLRPDARTGGADFDRFGIITTCIDGNGQEVYLDDLKYTAQQ